MISLIVVNYRSAALAIEAIRTARETTAAALEVIVVDNSCDAAEADALRVDADVVIASATNRGYAGGINDGRKHARGEILVVSNPDVTFAPGAVDALARAVDDGAAVAGPAFFWDEALTWMLPPSDLHTGPEKLGEVLASRSPVYAKARDRNRIRRRIAFWSLTETTEVKALSGAVLAIRSSAFDAVDGFDERFALYFEENDFLRRVSARRQRVVYVPAARCRHLYNQSAAQSPEAAAKYGASELRYLEKWNGPFMARLLKKLERERCGPDIPVWPAGATDKSVGPTLIEASPLPTFETAAGSFTTAIDVPPDVWRAYRGGALYFRVINRDTAEVLSTHARYGS